VDREEQVLLILSEQVLALKSERAAKRFTKNELSIILEGIYELRGMTTHIRGVDLLELSDKVFRIMEAAND